MGKPDQKDLNENMAATQGLSHMISDCKKLFQVGGNGVPAQRCLWEVGLCWQVLVLGQAEGILPSVGQYPQAIHLGAKPSYVLGQEVVQAACPSSPLPGE